MKPMMKCGHVANSTTMAGKPCCVICFPSPSSIEIVKDQPDLTDRVSRCAYCKKTASSSPDLAFFNYTPDKNEDNHYDGCRGWD